MTFKALFKEGMTLVEDAAAYLDGPGRKEAKLLTRGDALAYASESMRLTTRLMQLASWLLLQRAVNEGELTFDQARTEFLLAQDRDAVLERQRRYALVAGSIDERVLRDFKAKQNAGGAGQHLT